MKFFHNIFKTMVLFATIVTISFGSTNQSTYEYKYNSNKWVVWDKTNDKKFSDFNSTEYLLTIDALYNFLKSKPVDEVISTIISLINKQNAETNTTNKNHLKEHIVEKGHFGWIPYPPTSHTEKDGQIKVNRLETNIPRSYFAMAQDLKTKLDKYISELKTKLDSNNGIITAEIKSSTLVQAYEDLYNTMKTEAEKLVNDFFDSKYSCTEFDLDNKNKTIRIIAQQKDPKTRNGFQNSLNNQSYDGTNYTVCIYLKIENNNILIKSIFPAKNLDYMGGRRPPQQDFSNLSIEVN